MLSDSMIKAAAKLLQGNKTINSDIRAAISKLNTALHIREVENTNTDLLSC